MGLSNDLAITRLDIYPRELEVSVCTETYMALFTPASLVIEKYEGEGSCALERAWLSHCGCPYSERGIQHITVGVQGTLLSKQADLKRSYAMVILFIQTSPECQQYRHCISFLGLSP